MFIIVIRKYTAERNKRRAMNWSRAKELTHDFCVSNDTIRINGCFVFCRCRNIKSHWAPAIIITSFVLFFFVLIWKNCILCSGWGHCWCCLCASIHSPLISRLDSIYLLFSLSFFLFWLYPNGIFSLLCVAVFHAIQCRWKSVMHLITIKMIHSLYVYF